MRLSPFFLLLLSAFFVSSSLSAQVSQLRYNVLNTKREKIGEVSATRRTQGAETVYETELNISVRFILRENIRYRAKSIIRNGVLLSSSGIVYVNDKTRTTCTAQYKGNHYEVKRDDEITEIKNLIVYSASMMYFIEPGPNARMFSETNGYENRIASSGNHNYVLTDAKTGKENRYLFKNGMMESAFIYNRFVDVIVERAN